MKSLDGLQSKFVHGELDGGDGHSSFTPKMCKGGKELGSKLVDDDNER